MILTKVLYPGRIASRLMLACVPADRCHRMNCVAAGISVLTFLVLVLNFHTSPVGGASNGKRLSAATPTTTKAPLSPEAEAALARASGSNASPAGGVNIAEIRRQVHAAVHQGRLALQFHIAQLEIGRLRLQQLPHYTCQFTKQERVDGSDLQDEQILALKFRQQPFSVYLKWLEGGDVGREVLFVSGVNDDRMVVKAGRGFARLAPAISLRPNESLAMSESRHPVTQLGLLNMADLILKSRRRDLELKSGVTWELIPGQEFADRPCHCFVTVYESREVESLYRKSVVHVDDELMVPVSVQNFTWLDGELDPEAGTLDEQTLIEAYSYTNIHFDSQLADIDFDRANPDYRLR
jgi:hypothetical protein